MAEDCNARTGREERRVALEIWERREEEGEKRRSKVGKIDRQGSRLVEFLEERGWMIFYGTEGDEERELSTFIGGRGCTVIDYVMGNKEIREELIRLEIGNRMDLDYSLVKVVMGEWLEERRKGGK